MSTQRSPDRERAALRRQAAHEAAATTETPPAHPLLTLQHQVGNAQVARMLAQREEMPEEEAVAAGMQAQRDPALQREDAPEEDAIQAQPEVGMEGGPISEGLASRINAQRGGGSSLAENTRTQMENNFGTSFADVRIHTGSESHQLNRSVGAKAFTTGNDIFFGPNGNPADQTLLAHELTHVVQQRGMSHSGPMTVGPANDSYEQQADSAAAAVTAGGSLAQAQRNADETAT